MTSISIAPSQAQARKRRKEILTSHKTAKRQRIDESEDDQKDASSTTNSSPSHADKSKLACNAKVIKSNTKYQNRYEPVEPMSKEQEAEWRKEARRQRNRESAAASRNKVRNRIQELEKEVEEWKNKYSSLMKRLDVLEKSAAFPQLPPSSPTAIPPSPIHAPKMIYVPSSISTCSEEQNELPIPLVPSLANSKSHVMSSIDTRQQQPPPPPAKEQRPTYEQNVPQNVDLHVIEITSRSRPAVKITDENLQQVVTNVTNDWNIVSNNNSLGDNYEYSNITSSDDGMSNEYEDDRSDFDNDFLSLMHDALYDFDFNEANVEILLE